MNDWLKSQQIKESYNVLNFLRQPHCESYFIRNAGNTTKMSIKCYKL